MKAYPQGYIPMALQTRAMQYKTIAPASVTLAQAIVEGSDSDYDDGEWYDSPLVAHNNVFGHKYVPGLSIASGYIQKQTSEYDTGDKRRVVAPFATYEDLDQCFEDHARIMQLRYYDAARQYLHHPEEYAKRLSGVYSTDPEYGNTLIKVMRHTTFTVTTQSWQHRSQR